MNYFKKENYLNFGLILILLSTTLFLIEPESFKESSNFFTFLFFVHYSLPIVYCLVLKNAFDRGFFSLFGSKIYSGHLLLLVLFNISAFSLNREIAIFYESATWLTVLLVFENSLLILIAFLKEVPKWLRAVLILSAPIYLLIHLHQTFIILPMSFFGFIGGLFLGVGLLLFVPVFYMTAIIRILRNLDFSIQDLRLVSLSTLVVATVIVYHFFTWENIDERIQNGYLVADTPFHQSELPTWVAISKNIKSDYLTEAYLKSDLVYQKYEKFGFFAPDFDSFNEKKIHDPLITICMGSSHKQAMDEESRIKVLNFLYDKRHQTADRFWRGDHLTTDQVVTNIQVFPEERLTYSELILTISNNDRRNRWRPQEEAVYTFQLPEGGVITSLSLWIEGKEEKAILTTKSKAETAYNTIVGREMRDPSVIYWMEGNKARIKVFPCTPDENRKFKLGVTAPLKLEAESLLYQPIFFEGPDFSKARSSINIVTNGAKVNSELPFKINNDFISWKGSYSPIWTFKIESKPVSEMSFSFMDENFISKETQNKLRSFNPEVVYLDVSNNWTEEDFDKIKAIYPYQTIRILDGPEHLISPIEYPNFTLFPYHRVSSPGKAIILTKGGINTPNLEDLKDSEFRKNLFTHLNKSNAPILVLDLGTAPSDYNQSLKEFGVISHHQIKLSDLHQFASTNMYPDPAPTPNIVNLAGNGISIEKVINPSTTRGSYHLMRLFYYQSIMNQIGNAYFSAEEGSYIEETLTDAASIANVVTPLSSLIVLESQEDYDRFEIERNKDSLGNASISNQGAVPEPHEWALIIVGLSMVIILYFKKGFSLF